MTSHAVFKTRKPLLITQQRLSSFLSCMMVSYLNIAFKLPHVRFTLETLWETLTGSEYVTAP